MLEVYGRCISLAYSLRFRPPMDRTVDEVLLHVFINLFVPWQIFFVT